MYVLAKSSKISEYTLCSMRSFLYPNCSTNYTVSGIAGGQLASNCDDEKDTYSYKRTVADVPIILSQNWTTVAAQWASALSLNDGMNNANSSNARLLTQMIPTGFSLSPLKPSIAEALAVLSGCTLLLGATSSPFNVGWPYAEDILSPGVYQSFKATVRSQQYTSGYTQTYQAIIFYPVLILVFVGSAFCLIYHIYTHGIVTDYTEPQNLFALAINSPPSDSLSGSCGAGPEGKQLGVAFFVNIEEHSEHLFISEKEEKEEDKRISTASGFEGADGRRVMSSAASSYSRLSSRRSFL